MFGTHELRDIFYRAATDLIQMARRGEGSITVGEAVAVLLQTWNQAYYRYRRADATHFDAVEQLLVEHGPWLDRVADRSIESLAESDNDSVSVTFSAFDDLLGPVGAAKAMHLLAPRFLPLWDRRIARAYGLGLGSRGTNGQRYVRFMTIAQEQARSIGGEPALGRNILKALDEYNYCHFTKAWM